MHHGLIHELPEHLLHTQHLPLSETESEEQVQTVLALIEQVLATDNQQGEASEQYDLDPRPGHVLLRNTSPGAVPSLSNLEEAEAHFRGTLEDGFLECKFKRFSAEGELVRIETLKTHSQGTLVEILRKVWKSSEEEHERVTYYYIDRHDPKRSYWQTTEQTDDVSEVTEASD